MQIEFIPERHIVFIHINLKEDSPEYIETVQASLAKILGSWTVIPVPNGNPSGVSTQPAFYVYRESEAMDSAVKKIFKEYQMGGVYKLTDEEFEAVTDSNHFASVGVVDKGYSSGS